MAIAKVMIIAAGKSGLEALPHFQREFQHQGYQMLPALGLDHDTKTIDAAKQKTVNLDPAPNLKSIQMETTGEGNNLLRRKNPDAVGPLHDNPAAIACWCIVELQQHAQEVLRTWKESYARNRPATQTKADPFLVVIPYCPEGPTSGTIGMHIGAVLKKTFAQEKMDEDEYIICGVELCPPTSHPEQMGQTESIAAFRGYVARQEMLEGVPLSKSDPEDKNFQKCFDVNLVFDASKETISEERLQELDRAAAQGTALMFNGVTNNRDVMEAVTMMRQGRWEISLVHVTSEKEYSPVIICNGYRRKLPWNSRTSQWEKWGTKRKCREFLKAFKEIEEELEQANVNGIQEWVKLMTGYADEIDGTNLAGKKIALRKARKEAAEILARAIKQDEAEYARLQDEARKVSNPNEPAISDSSHVCINIRMPEQTRNRVADGDRIHEIAELVTETYQQNVQQTVKNKITKYLNRPDCDSEEHNAEAFFDKIAIASITDDDESKNLVFEPVNLNYYMSRAKRTQAGKFSQVVHTINQPLMWKLMKEEEVEYDIPVEYTLLVAAQIREKDRFKDIGSYPNLRLHYEGIIKDPGRRKEHLKYYAVETPSSLLPDLWPEHEEEEDEDSHRTLYVPAADPPPPYRIPDFDPPTSAQTSGENGEAYRRMLLERQQNNRHNPERDAELQRIDLL